MDIERYSSFGMKIIEHGASQLISVCGKDALLVALHTNRFSSEAGDALHPSGGSCEMAFRSAMSLRLAAVAIGRLQVQFTSSPPESILPTVFLTLIGDCLRCNTL